MTKTLTNNLNSLVMSLLFVTLLVFGSCQSGSNQDKSAVKEDDFLWQWIDSTRNPGEDFFKYATGDWMKNNPIPASEKRWAISNLVQDDNYEKLLKLSQESAANTNNAKGSNAQKVGDFWASGMDTLKTEAEGLKPISGLLSQIDAIQTRQEMLDLLAEFHKIISDPLFYIAIYQDEMNSDKYAVHLYQGGIGLPDRDYYFNSDSRTQNIRNEYQMHLVKMFVLLGETEEQAVKSSRVVYQIEKDLASASRKLEELRDPYANYNKMSSVEFEKLVPALNWTVMKEKLGMARIDSIIVAQPEFFRQVEKSLGSVSIDNWKTYLRWNLINNYSEYLSSAFDNQNFEFYRKILSGVTSQRPRWKRVLEEQENYLGDALGQLYVAKYVSPKMRERYDLLVQNMMDTYKERIQQLDWMTTETKDKALFKLSKVSRKVCYPDKWKDYSGMEVNRNSYAGNVMNCKKWQYDYYLKKLQKPVDRSEWDMTPQTYNAYYNPSNNEIVLPAAIFLIPGLPDSLADDAIIYGYAAASTIGHELTHGFDDQGRQFDASGNLSNWWNQEDSIRFSKQAALLVQQFNDYVVLDSLHINGEASLGENIADLGGVVIGLAAFKKTEQFKKGIKIDGLTPVQRYFLGYTMGWLGHTREAALAMQVMTDVHAPNFLRVNGPFANVPEFYEAFGIKEGDKMWRPDSLRIRIW